MKDEGFRKTGLRERGVAFGDLLRASLTLTLSRGEREKRTRNLPWLSISID
jgi:hypothetical protein